MDMKLEVVILPVSDVDRAKEFYERIGFHLDVDHQPNEAFRVVQFTPPGSACSITFGVGLGEVADSPIKGLHLCVTDIEEAHAALSGRGVGLTPIRHMGAGGWEEGPDPDRSNYGSYVFFNDPDDNGWALQEVGYRTSREERHEG
jgi:catechol 2,3-dioxygenase-like lactoylglutathione lyase family enzyme